MNPSPSSSPTMADALAIFQAKWGFPSFKPAQETLIQAALDGKDVLGVLPTGFGKCFGKGTPILMYDGTVRPVEEVKVGDLLMGPDSQPRRVLNTTKGHSRLYRVIPKKGDSYVVNADHVLSLRKTTSGHKHPSDRGGAVVNVTVADWLTATKTFQHTHKGWRAGVTFPDTSRSVDLPPYILGVWLGDGHSAGPRVTNMDPEVREELQQFAETSGLDLSEYVNSGGCPTFSLTHAYRKPGRGTYKHHTNPFMAALLKFNLIENKHVPLPYKAGSRSVRLDVLAGLIDTDGSYSPAGAFDVTFKLKQLAEDTAFIARSLGLAAYVTPCEKTCTTTGVTGQYYRVLISGDLDIVPTRITRKQAAARRSKKNVLNVGIRVMMIGPGDYYGFSVDGDHLFLLGDFTVTHNSAIFQVLALITPGTAIVVSPLIALMKDQVDDCNKKGITASFVNSHLDEDEIEERLLCLRQGKYKLFYVAPERIGSNKFRDALQLTKVSYLVVDEVHCVSRHGHDFRPSYMRIKTILDWCVKRPVVIGVTATATHDIETDIAKGTGMKEGYVRVVGDPVRENLNYMVLHGNSWTNFKNVAAGWGIEDGSRYVVYGGTRKGCETLARILIEEHPHFNGRIGFYHAGMDKTDRTRMQDEFKDGTTPVIVATNAFGMGIDIPNIRAVLHFGIPGSIEDYCQEAGRAGRDGKPSDVVLVSSDYSETMRQMFLDRANPPYSAFKLVWSWLHKQPRCVVLKYTGEQVAEDIGKTMNTIITGEEVRGVLSTMESYGVVNRVAHDHSLEMTIWFDKLRNAELTSPNQRKLQKYIIETFGPEEKVQKGPSDSVTAVTGVETNETKVALHAKVRTSTNKSTTVTFDKEEAARKIKVPEIAMYALLRKLTELKLISTGSVFRGKTTQVPRHMWEEDLEDYVPEADIVAKRSREQARLDAMLWYAHVQNRTQFIRDYFLGE